MRRRIRGCNPADSGRPAWGAWRAGAVLLLLASCGGGGGGDAAPPASPAPPPLALPANRVSAASPVQAGCTGSETPGSGTVYAEAEAESFLARHPNNPQHLVAVWQQDRWSDGGARAIVSAVSFDGGANWTRRMHAFSRCAGASNLGFERASDPWVDVAPDGTVLVMALALSGQAFTASSRSAMVVARSTDGGLSFAAPQLLVSDAGANLFNDKNTLTIDPTDPRRVVAVWDRLEANGDGPTLLARSTDGGASWLPTVEMYRPPPPPGGISQTIGNRIVVLPGGPQRGLMVNVFTQIDTLASNQGGSSSNRVRVQTSADGGLSWNAPVTVAEHRGVGTVDPRNRGPVRDGFIIPSVAVAPDGTLWVAWQDSRFDAGQRDAIALSRSTDGGQSWSAPVRASSASGAAAFTPTLAVRADGLLALMYLDLRPAATPGVGLPAAVWLASTRDGQRFAETPVWPLFDLAGAPNARGLFLGDYHGLVALGDEVQALLVLSTQDLANRNDVFALRVTPALPAAALGAPAAGVATRLSVAPVPVPVMSAADESAFRARRSAATQAYLAGRLAAVDADAGAVWPRRR